MKNNRGQALVEFIIVLPVFLLLVIAVIDFGNILSKKYVLENDLDTISDMYKKEDYDKINNYVNDKGINIEYKDDNEFIVIKLNRSVKVTSPMLNLILGKSYSINTSKTMYKDTYEQ